MSLFENDFDDLICVRFGKAKKMSQESKVKLISSTDNFALKSGLKEINQLKRDVSSFLEKYEESILADLLDKELKKNLKNFLKNLRKMERILNLEFDSKMIIKEYGPEGYKQLINYRNSIINDLKAQYVQITEEDEHNV